MTRSLARLALLVADYDPAIAWFRDRLGFRLIEDTPLGEGKRWVRMATDAGAELLLARANGAEQEAAVGRQGGGRVFLFLETDDFARDHAAMRAKGIAFEAEPRREPYGTVAVFRDPFGNRWDLVEPRRPPAP